MYLGTLSFKNWRAFCHVGISNTHNKWLCCWGLEGDENAPVVFQHEVTSWPEKNCLVGHLSEAKTYKGTDIKSVAFLYMFMHRKMSFSREGLSKRDLYWFKQYFNSLYTYNI